jgi:hypothetical protein
MPRDRLGRDGEPPVGVNFDPPVVASEEVEALEEVFLDVGGEFGEGGLLRRHGILRGGWD